MTKPKNSKNNQTKSKNKYPTVNELRHLVPIHFKSEDELKRRLMCFNPSNLPMSGYMVELNDMFGMGVPEADLVNCEKNLPRYLLVKFLGKASYPSFDTVKSSNLKYPLIFWLQPKALNNMMRKYDEKRLADQDYNGKILEYYKELAGESEVFHLIKDFFRVRGWRDVYELREIFEVLVDISRSYNFVNHNVNGLVEVLLESKLSFFRISRESFGMGVLEVKQDKWGNVSRKVSAVEEAKIRFNEAKMSVYLALDKVMEGEKLNVSVDGVFSVGDFMKGLREVKDSDGKLLEGK